MASDEETTTRLNGFGADRKRLFDGDKSPRLERSEIRNKCPERMRVFVSEDKLLNHPIDRGKAIVCGG